MEYLHQLLGDDLQGAGLIILNLIVIESLLSVDNAAVLATMVMDLPEKQRSKALKYGIIGAYVFRGLCLIYAAWLVNIWWLKPIGGFYLLYLAFAYFNAKSTKEDEGGEVGFFAKYFSRPIGSVSNFLFGPISHWFHSKRMLLGQFWATVALVEVMDLAFSIDNVFAAVAFTDKIVLIWIGVFIGILAMRFVAQGFVGLMERFPFLETVAFLVIGVLGLKLSVSLYCHFYSQTAVCVFLESEQADLFISIFTVDLFLLPVMTSLLFNFPRKQVA